MRGLDARSRGFTLIELVVTVAVLAILLVLAVPSFSEFRQRTALRGAADQIASFWGDMRFEALRRNSLIKVELKQNGTNFCLAARTTTASSAADDTCDCFTAGNCSVAGFPANQSEWRGVRLPATATIGDGATRYLVIDPKRGGLLDSTLDGSIFMQSANLSSADYRLNVVFDRNGRAFICEPSNAPSKLPQFTDRRC